MCREHRFTTSIRDGGQVDHSKCPFCRIASLESALAEARDENVRFANRIAALCAELSDSDERARKAEGWKSAAESQNRLWSKKCEELTEAQAVLEIAIARAEKAEASYRFMVEKAADSKLDGYRELGNRAAQAEEERDAAVAQLKDANEDLDGWRNLGREIERHDPMFREDRMILFSGSAAAFRGMELALTSMREERDDMRCAMEKIAMSVGCDTPLQLTAIATNDEDTTADLLVKFIAMKLDSARAEAVRKFAEWAGMQRDYWLRDGDNELVLFENVAARYLRENEHGKDHG